MNYRHKKTSGIYRRLFSAFDVSRQVAMVVYVSSETGAIFTREEDAFNENFEVVENPQSLIVPKNRNQSELPI